MKLECIINRDADEHGRHSIDVGNSIIRSCDDSIKSIKEQKGKIGQIKQFLGKLLMEFERVLRRKKHLYLSPF